LGGAGQTASFITTYGESEPAKAIIKLGRAESREELLPRWERAAKLSHPNLIRLYQVGSLAAEDAEAPFVVMEYAEEDLASVLQIRPLTTGEAREMVETIAGVLDYIHGQGLAHGHLRPANIMAVEDGLKISSDGIRAAGEARGATPIARLYDAPEIRDGAATPEGDIWAVGVTLVEAVTQRLPRLAGGNEEPALPAKLPAEFQGLARQCLQVDPQRRATVKDLRVPTGQVMARPEVRERKKMAAGPLKGTYVAAAAAGIGLVALSVIALPHRRQEPRSPAPVAPEGSRPQAERSKEPPPPAAAPEVKPEPQTGAADRSAPKAPKSTPSPQVVRQVMPNVPQKARDTITGTVRVSIRAHVDGSGHVTGAEIDNKGPSEYFAQLALNAAKRWEFDSSGAGDWLLRFEFSRSATRAHPARVTP
jgi:TonB family protein